MRTTARGVTKKFGVYNAARHFSDRLKWSKGYEYAHDATHPASQRAKQREFDLFKSLVPPTSLCFDVGANIGDKTNMFVKHQCRVIAVEPVRRNIQILRKRFGRVSRVMIVEGAVSDHLAREPINVVDENTSFSSFNRSWVESLEDKARNRWGVSVQPPSVEMVDTTTLDLLIEQYGRPYYVKIDVEGHEIHVLRGLTRAVPLISIEANLPEFIDETLSCVSKLSALAPDAVFNYTTESQDRFELAEWMSAAAFHSWLEATDARFMEIYCRMS